MNKMLCSLWAIRINTTARMYALKRTASVLTVIGLLSFTGCVFDDVSRSTIYFTNTSSMNPSWNLVIYDSAGNIFNTVGTVVPGVDTIPIYVPEGDYYIASADSGAPCILGKMNTSDGNLYTCTFYSVTLGGTTCYGCDITHKSNPNNDDNFF